MPIEPMVCCRLGEVGKQEQKMRSELARFKQQVQAQRDASALQLRQLQQASPAGSTSEAVSALSASTASSERAFANQVLVLHSRLMQILISFASPTFVPIWLRLCMHLQGCIASCGVTALP